MPTTLKNLLQHYNKDEEKFIRNIYNSMEEVLLKYSVKNIGFCNQNEINIILTLQNIFQVNIKIDGGYSNAEKKFIILSHPDLEAQIELTFFELVYNTKFNTLAHKNIMGTLYNQGINERLIGDIIVDEENKVQIIVDKSLQDSLPLFVPKYSNIKVKYTILDNITISAKPLTDKVSSSRSLRIDAICKGILRTSRKKVQNKILKKEIQLNSKTVEKFTETVTENDELSIRGYGKIIINKIIFKNKKYNIYFKTTNNE